MLKKLLQSKEKLISEMKMSFHEGPPLQMDESVSSGDGSLDGGSGIQSPVSIMSKSQIVTGGTSQFEMMKLVFLGLPQFLVSRTSTNELIW